MLRPERLVAARELLSITQTELAGAAGVTQSMVSMIEKHRREFAPALGAAFANGLNLPIEFFAVPSADISTGTLNFRKNSTAPVKVTRRTERVFREAFRVAESLLDESGYPRPRLPVIQDEEPSLTAKRIGQIADEARRALAVDADAPVRNVLRTLERAGIGIAPIGFTDDALPGHDGLSYADGPGRATFIGYVNKTGDRNRFTLAHELGHLVLHSYRDSEDREFEAHLFAGAFLVPDAQARLMIDPDATLKDFVRMKASWGMSVAALVKRGHAVGVLTRERVRTLYRQIRSRGWSTSEPVEVTPETPRLLFRLMQQRYGDNPYGNEALPRALALPALHLRALAPPPPTTRTAPRKDASIRPIATLHAR